MTLSFQVGDRIRVCASVDDYCGIETQGLVLKEQGISLASDSCPVSDRVRECKQISGISVNFRFAQMSGSAECHSCSPIKAYHNIGTGITNAKGLTAVEYDITAQDFADFQEAQAAGIPFKLLSCITDDLGQGIVRKGECSDPLVIVPIPATEPQGAYKMTITYWELPFWHMSAETVTEAVKAVWDAINPSGWQWISSSVDTSSKTMTVNLNRNGSILLSALILALSNAFASGSLLSNLWNYIKGFFFAITVVSVGQPAFTQIFKDGFFTAKTKACDAVQRTNMSADNKAAACAAIATIQPDTNDINKAWETYKEKVYNSIREAVLVPTIYVPMFVLTGSSFEIKGKADPSIQLDIKEDDKFSIWDIFRGDPFHFIDSKLGTVTTDASGNYKFTTKFMEQNVYRVYAIAGGKESPRAKIYVLDGITVAIIVGIIGIIAYLIYLRRMR